MKRTCAAAVLAVGLCGCGLGTEIGNGVKPRGDGTQTNGGGKATPDNTNGTPQAGASPAASAPAAPGKSSTGAGVPPADASTSQTGVAATPPLPFDIDVLTAPCGSVFSRALTSPLTLFHRPGGGAAVPVLTATQDATTKIWTLTDAGGTVLRHVVKDLAAAKADPSSIAVVTTDDAGAPVPATLKCTVSPSAAVGGSQTQAVHLAGGALVADVAWIIGPAATGAGTPQLTSVTLRANDKGDVPVPLTTAP